MTRRRSIHLDGFGHKNPIPAACRVGDVVYSSAIHGIDRERTGPPATLDEQAELMFARMREILAAAGATTDDVVKVNMWMRDRSDRESVNRHWLQMFPDAADRPARHTVTTPLEGEQLIQCDFVAIVDDTRERGDGRS